jgi:hypothetical protein
MEPPTVEQGYVKHMAGTVLSSLCLYRENAFEVAQSESVVFVPVTSFRFSPT